MRAQSPERSRRTLRHATPGTPPRAIPRPRVAVVMTVRNEAGSIAECLRSITQQTRTPDEVVVVDGGSTDGTWDLLETAAAADPRIRVHSAPGANIARGRNIGIHHTPCRIIAVTDAGTVLRADWLAQLVRPLEVDPSVGVSAGFYVAGGTTFFERCLSAAITPQQWEINPETFLPSSRSLAFRKDWWARVNGYPEWLRYCEDLVFDLELKRAGARFVFVPAAVATWNARPNLRAFFRQYFEYARGDGHAGLWPARHAVRYAAYALGVILVALAIEGGRTRAEWALGIAAVGGIAYAQKFIRRLWYRWPVDGWRRAGALALVPVILATGDIAKMLGYPLGRIERAERRRAATGETRQQDRQGIPQAAP
jgi:glycosyltransferase involved in cell wall biosynthesis